MKPKSSCDSCRQRHRKCITRPNAPRCNGCDELDRQCTLSPAFQFRPSKRPDGHRNDRSGPRPRHEGAHPAPQLETQSRDQTSPASEQASVGLAPTVNARDSIATWPPPTARSPRMLTQREALLYRTWVQKIALMSDAIDDERHFAVAVSRLALEKEVLLNGILGLASRFDMLAHGSHGTGPDMESALYHGRCMELLIDLLDKPSETYDATLLAAVVLSRLYEENDTETDSLTYHLAGTSTLLGHEVITRLAAEGGLAEAACWVHLRQAIYVAIVHRQHLAVPLRVYENLTAFRKANDTAYANRIVYLLARILLHYFPEQNLNGGAFESEGNWQLLQGELDTWFRMKPTSFDSIYSEPPDAEGGEPFPRIWMASTVASMTKSPALPPCT